MTEQQARDFCRGKDGWRAVQTSRRGTEKNWAAEYNEAGATVHIFSSDYTRDFFAYSSHAGGLMGSQSGCLGRPARGRTAEEAVEKSLYQVRQFEKALSNLKAGLMSGVQEVEDAEL